jgi:hypothetical protein
VSDWTPNFTPGPYWTSFEHLRTAGSTALEGVRPGTVATLASKAGLFRILRDDDFQRILGLASEVHRIRSGITFVVQAAKVVAKHKDQDSLELLIRSVSMLSESTLLPQRTGHGQFEITPEEAAENSDADFDVNTINIPRPL